MCGILGFATRRPGDPAIWSAFEAAFRLSEARGRDASGVAGHAGAGIAVHKRAVPASELLGDEGYRAVRLLEPEVVIAHTRLATKGSPADNANNHPICAGPVVGVHNGMLRNDDALFRVLGLRRDGEVDSEAIVRLVEFFCPERITAWGLWKALDLVEGSYAVALVHARQPGELWLARGTRPLAAAWDPERETFWFASEARFLTGAYEEALGGVGLLAVWEVPEGAGLRVRLRPPRGEKGLERFRAPVREGSFAWREAWAWGGETLRAGRHAWAESGRGWR